MVRGLGSEASYGLVTASSAGPWEAYFFGGLTTKKVITNEAAATRLKIPTISDYVDLNPSATLMRNPVNMSRKQIPEPIKPARLLTSRIIIPPISPRARGSRAT